MATGQRHSPVLGSSAIVASVLIVFPAVRGIVAAFAGYATVWVGFNVARAFADDADLGVASQGTVSTLESTMFGGVLPSHLLQRWFFDSTRLQSWDIGFVAIYGSFFLSPFVLAALIWWKRRNDFLVYAAATAISFGLGLVGFLLLPTEPPWMSDPAGVTRVTHRLVDRLRAGSTTSDGAFGFEPNGVAAMPSVHVAAVVLVWFGTRLFGRKAGLAGATYAVAMSISVVYLGEHFVLDALGGWVIALLGWKSAIAMRQAASLVAWRSFR
jgi:membrane-associated phospholipid phosphatase